MNQAKILGIVGMLSLMLVVGGSFFAPPVASAQLTTTTLGTAVDSINSTWYDYFTVLLAKYWPFLVGAIILVGIWHFGKRLLFGFR